MLFAFQVQLAGLQAYAGNHAILNAINRLPIAIFSNQSRQVLQHQQLTAILNDKNNAINQAVDRLDKGIVLFYLQLFGSLAKCETIL